MSKIDETSRVSVIVGAMAVIIAILLAAVLWFWYDRQQPDPHPSTVKIEQTLKETVDQFKKE